MKKQQISMLPEEMGNRAIARENSQMAEQVVKIELDKIIVRQGFNVRMDYGDIESLADSILANGQQVPGRVEILKDGHFVLVEGHRRLAALQLIKERTKDAPKFKAIVNPSGTTEEGRILQMFTTQDTKPLEPIEVAELLQRLVNIGYSQTEVAAKIGKTPSYVSQMLALAKDSPEVKKAVREGALTASGASKLRKHQPEAGQRGQIVKAQREKGNKKVDVDSVVDAKGKKAEKILKIFEDVTGFVSSSEKQELLDKIKAIL